MSGEPVHPVTKAVAGFVSLTEVLAGEHRSYNAWHMLEHMPEQYPIPGIVGGQRWVLSPACAAACLAATPPLDAAHYLTLYLMAEPVDATLADFFRVARRLHELDRFHEHRRSHLSGPFRVTQRWAAPSALVSPDAVPHRPNRGVFVLVEAHDEPVEAEPARTDELLDVRGVAGIWSFASDPQLGAVRHAAGEWRIVVVWLDEDPLAVTAAAGERLVAGLASPGVAPTLAGPLETITPWRWDWFD